ncbi:hypothetical protein ACIBKX_40345 [Streptomyces sp. NPDC050658]|uniref:hypothetical protein n=1 Tax=unclassified Streptomyces TaxID=2593676 RepID=UPI003444F37B
MPDKPDDKCELIKGTPGYDYCTGDDEAGDPPSVNPDDPGAPDADTGFASEANDQVNDLAHWLIKKTNNLIAPKDAWAPEKPGDALFEPFLWLGQHLAIAIFTCVVMVCALTAWQGAPRLKQMGNSTGWTLVAVIGMAAVPGAVMLLNDGVSEGFTEAFNSDQSTLFGAIKDDLKNGADAENPLAQLIITAALVVALGFAALVFATRQLGILAFVCISPIVIASLARGGDTEAIQRWAQRLLGLMFAPFALLFAGVFTPVVEGSLVMDAVLLVAADVLMLRMIFHGLPYFGPRMARAARSMVENRVNNPLVQRAVRAGVPDFYEQENTPRGPRTVMTPGRAMAQDGDALASAYGLKVRKRPGRMTTDSVVAQAQVDGKRQERVMRARREARAQHAPPRPTPPASGSGPTPGGGSGTP